MISIKALGMYSSDFSGGETRNGDTQIVINGKYCEVIDGGCDRYATRLITHLKSSNIRDPYLHISHCHYDHRDGIDKILSDPWFKPRGLYCQDPDSITGHSSAIRSDINALRKIIDKAIDASCSIFQFFPSFCYYRFFYSVRYYCCDAYFGIVYADSQSFHN